MLPSFNRLGEGAFQCFGAESLKIINKWITYTFVEQPPGYTGSDIDSSRMSIKSTFSTTWIVELKVVYFDTPCKYQRFLPRSYIGSLSWLSSNMPVLSPMSVFPCARLYYAVPGPPWPAQEAPQRRAGQPGRGLGSCQATGLSASCQEVSWHWQWLTAAADIDW